MCASTTQIGVAPSGGQGVTGLVDRLPDRLDGQRCGTGHRYPGITAGVQVDVDRTDAVEPGDLLGHCCDAVRAGHSGDRIRGCGSAHRVLQKEKRTINIGRAWFGLRDSSDEVDPYRPSGHVIRRTSDRSLRNHYFRYTPPGCLDTP